MSMTKMRLHFSIPLSIIFSLCLLFVLIAFFPGKPEPAVDPKVAGEQALYRLAADISSGSAFQVDGYEGFVREGAERAKSGRKMVVFFDPLCQYCRSFWEASEGVDVHQVWVPVALLNNGESAPMSGWLLETAQEGHALNPSDQFSKMKAALALGKRVEAYSESVFLEKVQANTKRFADSGQQGVPTVAYLDENVDQIRVFRGAISRADIEKMIDDMANIGQTMKQEGATQ